MAYKSDVRTCKTRKRIAKWIAGFDCGAVAVKYLPLEVQSILSISTRKSENNRKSKSL
jgi:hypothetical protein